MSARNKKKDRGFIVDANLTLEEEYSPAYSSLKSRDPRVPLFKFNKKEKIGKIEKMKEVKQLKPKGSMISNSPLTNTNYHVIKFYARVRREGNSWVVVGFEASDQHPLGHCKYCEIEEDD